MGLNIIKALFKRALETGALGGIRTHNLLIRSQMLYPIELRVHRNNVMFNTSIHFILQAKFSLNLKEF